jgi:hypothetical protein
MGKIFLLCGFRINIDTPRKQELFVYKLDTLGNILKEASISKLAKGYKFWTSARFRDNKYYLSYGYNNTNSSLQDAATCILDSNLTIIQSNTFFSRGPNEEGIAYYLPLSNKKQLYIWLKDTVRVTFPPVTLRSAYQNSVLYLLDSNGVEEKRIGLFDFCPKYVYNIKELSNGDLLGVGIRQTGCLPPYEAVSKGWVVRISPTGQIKWERFLLDSLFGHDPYLLDFEEDRQGNLIISGGLFRHTNSHLSVWLMKLDSNGCLRPRCTESNIEVTITEADKIEYLTVSPNPAQNEVIINLPESIYFVDKEKFKVYDILGRLLMPPIKQTKEQLEIQTFMLPSGIYFVELLDSYRKRYLAKFVVSH